MSLLQERIVLLLELRGITQAEAARRGRFKNPAFINDIVRGHKNSVRGESINKLALAFGTTTAFLLGETENPDPIPVDDPPVSTHLPGLLGERDFKVLSTTEGSEDEMVVSTAPIEIVPRPWYMRDVREGFAILVTGESMLDLYEPGDMAIVNPRLPVVRNKEAIFIKDETRGEFVATIKRLMRSSPTEWHVKQYNPLKEFALSKREWPKALRVVGKYNG